MEDFKLTVLPAPPHTNAAVFARGNEQAPRALVLLHGRGGTARDILTLADAFLDDCFVVAPEAVMNEWYPQRFIVPQADNQPYLGSALSAVGAVIDSLLAAGFTPERIIIAGFSQGACLAAEYVKRNPYSYAGVVLMSGGLIGTDAEVLEGWSGQLQEVPIYIGSDVADTHIPWQRVIATGEAFSAQGAVVSCEQFEGYGHAPHRTALTFLESLLR